MSKLAILFALVLGFQAQVFAQTSVSVMIDGKIYSCTQGGVPAHTCAERAETMKTKYHACKAVRYGSDCFNSIYKTGVDKSCANMVSDCDTLCKQYFYASDCYNICF